MKTTDAAEVINGAHDSNEVPEREPAQRKRWPAQRPHADSADPHGVDGPDELEVAVGEGAGGIRVAGRFFGAFDAGHPGFQEAQEGAAGGGGDRKDGNGKADRGGAGTIRQLSANKMSAQVWIAILVGVAAAADDLARRQIANWIPAAALAGGLGWQIAQHGWWGWLYALGGAAAGFGVFLIFYLLGGMGGGDIKLMAGFGALLGVSRLLEAALWTAACGGILAALAIGFSTLRGLWRGAAGKGSPRSAIGERRRLESIPYAPAIAAGVLLSLVPKV